MNVKYTYDKYYTHGEMTDILQDYAKKHPDLFKLSSLAKTPEGRDIWLVTLTSPETGSHDSKPAYCVDANIHAGEVTGNMCAMYFLDYILSNLEDATVALLLKNYTFYVIPRISPDGSEAYLTTPAMLRSANRMYPFDEEQPGIQPVDLDGDGRIRKMRIKSPYGAYKVSEKDARVMIKRRPDDVEGEFYHVYTEGVFEKLEEYEGTHLFNAPMKWGSDFNRNFPAAWLPESGQRGAGIHPLHNPETKAMAEFLESHKNIFCVTNFHTAVGIYLHPPGFKHPTEAIKEDMDRYKEMGLMATEETGYPTLNIRDEYINPKAQATLVGSMDDYIHFVLGMFDYTVECWDLNPRSGVEMKFPPPLTQSRDYAEDAAHKYLEFVDKELGGEGFLNWTKFDHPQFGEVEIGGLDGKYVIQNCPPKLLLQECEKHTRFILRHAKVLPKIKFDKVVAEKVDSETYKVSVNVMNVGYLPTYGTKEFMKLRRDDDITVTLEGADLSYVNGLKAQKIGQLEGYSSIRGYAPSGATSDFPAPCEKKVTWIVKGKAGTTLTIKCNNKKIGEYCTTVTL